MKILITGTKGIAQALADAYQAHDVTCVSRSTGHDINNINTWGQQFVDHDMIINNAYDGFGQVQVLDYFFRAWKYDASKKIITIGSRSSYMPAVDTKNMPYWPYQVHKLALQQAHDRMIQEAECQMKIINPGPVDTQMIAHLTVKKISTQDLAEKIIAVIDDPTVRRIDLWL